MPQLARTSLTLNVLGEFAGPRAFAAYLCAVFQRPPLRLAKNTLILPVSLPRFLAVGLTKTCSLRLAPLPLSLRTTFVATVGILLPSTLVTVTVRSLTLPMGSVACTVILCGPGESFFAPCHSRPPSRDFGASLSVKLRISWPSSKNSEMRGTPEGSLAAALIGSAPPNTAPSVGWWMVTAGGAKSPHISSAGRLSPVRAYWLH